MNKLQTVVKVATLQPWNHITGVTPVLEILTSGESPVPLSPDTATSAVGLLDMPRLPKTIAHDPPLRDFGQANSDVPFHGLFNQGALETQNLLYNAQQALSTPTPTPDELAWNLKASGSSGEAAPAAPAKAAWVDEDDEDLPEVDLTSHNRLKKLRASRDEAKVSVKEYESRLRSRFTQMSGRQAWATQPATGEDSDDDFVPSLKKISDPTKLAIRRLTNVTVRQKSGYQPVTVLAWHPREKLLLSASKFSDSFRLNKVDGKKNTEVYSAKLKDFKIQSAAFLNNQEVAAVGPQGTVCLFDVNKQTVTAVKGACGTSRRDRKLWCLAPLGTKYFATATQGGEVLVSDTRSRKLAAKVQLGGPASVVMWHPNNGNLICADGRANVYEWDVGTRRCVSKVHDDLAVSITCGAPFDKGLAFGTSSSTMDVVDFKQEGGGGLGDFRTICDSLVNPLTSVCSMKGNVIFGATNAKNSAIRATNAGTSQTYSNWPTTISNLGRVESLAAKEDWLAMGNSRGQVLLFNVD
ncbi:U3 snoRNP protein [Perkinsus chesapeaki]|uniref:U3 snoRNP protein n=1 Tax=Perkinsus chesapeaki TaxID=330153 RepID=A0A7J6M893_PERCH|nr:U3 snoRNP protein [Perkinsus chesapeaki]